MRIWAGRVCWPLLVGAVMAQLGLAGLAVVEYVRLGWLGSFPSERAYVVIVALMGVAGLAGATRVALRAGRSQHALRRLRAALDHRAANRPGDRTALSPGLRAAAGRLGLAGRVEVLAAGEAFALTWGLARPRVLVSTAPLDQLEPAEVEAVLAHEREHLRRRDPARLLGARLLAGYAWLLPLAGWAADRYALGRELAADRTATAHAGSAAVAGALLKLADAPAGPATAAINPRHHLAARVGQVDGQRPRRPAPLPVLLRLVATSGNCCLLLVATACCVGLTSTL